MIKVLSAEFSAFGQNSLILDETELIVNHCGSVIAEKTLSSSTIVVSVQASSFFND